MFDYAYFRGTTALPLPSRCGWALGSSRGRCSSLILTLGTTASPFGRSCWSRVWITELASGNIVIETETYLQQHDWYPQLERQVRPLPLPVVGHVGTLTWRSVFRGHAIVVVRWGRTRRTMVVDLVGEKRKRKWGIVEYTGFNSLPYLGEIHEPRESTAALIKIYGSFSKFWSTGRVEKKNSILHSLHVLRARFTRPLVTVETDDRGRTLRRENH